jgi:hypothetical protein
MSDQGSSGDTSGSNELKAGHPPASKNNFIYLHTTIILFYISLNSKSWRHAGWCFSPSTNITR